MPVKILGISAFYHDSAAALVVDGEIVAAAQEERFTRRKHDDRFPSYAVAYCLTAGGVRIEDLDCVIFYDKPLLKFDRLVETCLQFAPRGFSALQEALPYWFSEKLFLKRRLGEELKAYGRPTRLGSPAPLCQTPPEPCGERLLILPVRRGRDSDDGWSWRVGNHNGRDRSWQTHRGCEGDSLPSFSWSAVFRHDVLHRVQGELRRVQM